MSSKRPSLSSMVKAAAGAPSAVPEEPRSPTARRSAEAREGDTPPKAKAPKSRATRVILGSYQTAEAVKQTKLLAIENDTTMQALLAEALNLLFQKYGKPTIAKP